MLQRQGDFVFKRRRTRMRSRLYQNGERLDSILDTAVAAWRNAPVPLQLEVFVALGRNQILADSRLRNRLQTAIFDRPGIAGRVQLPGIIPVIHGLTVE